MSSQGGNIDKPLELIQKTYTLQATTVNNHENPSQARVSVAKVSTHQPSRKTSVHDIHEVTRDDLNKILIDIQANLSRLKNLLEAMTSVPTTREEFFKLKDQIFIKIMEFISKLNNESGKRGSISSKGNSSNLISYHPQHLVYCIEYFRSELVKAKYLFSSLTLLSSIGTATLNSIQIRSFSISNIEQIPEDRQDMQTTQDLIQIKKDISALEEHAYVLTQRYYSQIPDWHTLGMSDSTMAIGRTMTNADGLPVNRLRLAPLTQKLSTASSVTSMDNPNFCARLYQKCQNICCMCTPNYI